MTDHHDQKDIPLNINYPEMTGKDSDRERIPAENERGTPDDVSEEMNYAGREKTNHDGEEHAPEDYESESPGLDHDKHSSGHHIYEDGHHDRDHSHGDTHSHDSLSCGCGHCHHDHEENDEDEKQQNQIMIGRLITSTVLLIIGLFFPEGGAGRFIFSLASAIAIGYDVILSGIRNLLHRELLDEKLLMMIACVGAFVLGEFTEGAMVLLLFQLGEFLQDLAVDRSRRSIAELMNIRPEEALVIREEQEIIVSPEEVLVGEIIVVKPGERIPLDGDVVEGESFLDTVALTGESVPRSVRPGQDVLSGCVNQRGLLKIRVTRPFSESAVSRILELVENATEHKSHADKFITRFAKVYTPAVVGAALVMLVLGGMITGRWAEWLRRSLTFLVISCPCALVISVPLSYFNGIGRASRKGILVKGSNILEELSNASVVAFDKTGTMTKGVFEVVAVHPEEMDEEAIVRLAASAEKYSTHPIAEAIRKSAKGWENARVEDCREIAGQGVVAVVNGKIAAVGNDRLMASEHVEYRECHVAGTIVHIAVNGKYEGHLVIADVVKESAAEAIRKLKEMGIRKTVMLTGDRKSAAEDIARITGVDEVYAELRPEEKVGHIYRLMAQRESSREKVVFIGDGINDAPVLATADLGVAMGTAGSDAAVEAADIVLIDDDPVKLAEGISLARRTQKIVKENIVFSIAVKVLVMILGAFGIVPLWLAVFSDVGVCLMAILNAIR